MGIFFYLKDLHRNSCALKFDFFHFVLATLCVWNSVCVSVCLRERVCVYLRVCVSMSACVTRGSLDYYIHTSVTRVLLFLVVDAFVFLFLQFFFCLLGAFFFWSEGERAVSVQNGHTVVCVFLLVFSLSLQKKKNTRDLYQPVTHAQSGRRSDTWKLDSYFQFLIVFFSFL